MMMIALTAIGAMELVPSTAQAQYSVYIYNVRRPAQGWFRSGAARDVNKSLTACYNSIVQRVNENRRYGTDFEAFGIHTGTAQRVTRPMYVLYVPRGYRVSLDAPEDGARLLCRGPGRAEALPWRRLRDEAA
jgi:hypothetical protein